MSLPLYPLAALPWDVAALQQPPPAYRGVPFWSWNNTVTEATVRQQIAQFAAMGMGGFHIHARTGLATPYLGETFMQMVQVSVTEARQSGMTAWLYDEDRWPSGSAGGLVTRDVAYRARHLLFTPFPYGTPIVATTATTTAAAQRTGNGYLLTRYQIVLGADGTLTLAQRLAPDALLPQDGVTWYAYLETATPSPWFNDQTYVDTLNPAAIQRFLALTHERYAATVGADFGGTIPAIFTDEPQFPHKQSLAYADERRDLIIPFTDDLPATFLATYGYDVLDTLPEIFWELPARQPSLTRYHYHDHVCERFTRAFADQIGQWCSAHGLRLTGHMMEEPNLTSQTSALGEAMRAYRSFHLPGMDLLMDRQEFTTAKQVQSAVHQYGREGMLSELYGVTNWDFSFAGHKAQGDWQAALGVTVRVPHLAWMSMEGEAKRDYPASIFVQSPWWREYTLIEEHFARVNLALTRGQRRVRVGVIHPIESFWLCFGPMDQTSREREERERAFHELTQWLLGGLIDFDFIAESLFPALCPAQEGPILHVGQATYDVIIVPGLRTIRATTLARLADFAASGGHILFAGEVPAYVDACPNDQAQRLADISQCLPFQRAALLNALEVWRDLDIRLADGSQASSVIAQMRQDEDDRYLFLCHTDRAQPLMDASIRVKGAWQAAYIETLDGTVRPIGTTHHHGWTQLTWDFPAAGSLLLRLTPGMDMLPVALPLRWHASQVVTEPHSVMRDEPNVLLLDHATWRLDYGDWQPEAEMLRIDNYVRAHLRLPLRGEATVQPWTLAAPEQHLATVHLRFTFHTNIPLTAPRFALEGAPTATISIADVPIATRLDGWFVAPEIPTLVLPDFSAGTHTLHVTLPFRRNTQLEWAYLLGEFGVQLQGRHARIMALPPHVDWGDWTVQGFPFYAGNMTYRLPFRTEGEQMALHIAHFSAPLIRVTVDGMPQQAVAFPPYQIPVDALTPGEHWLDLIAFGNRFNAFGALHNSDPHWQWWGPDAWRTTGDAWTDGYQIKPMGILSAPQLLRDTP